ncbi:MAG: serine/threonine-protein kinase [Gaiellaceae bacterium]
MSTTVAPPPPAELVLDRYRPLRPLGSGGSGSVWLARDEASGLDVALKLVPREGKPAARAEREAAAAARLRHPNCLRAFALAHDDRHVYIAYEFVPGHTMRQRMRAGTLDDRAAVETVAQLLDGLAHAHRHGIVHRDVKPSNVLIEEGDEVHARLSDFGLAQFEEAETLTAQGDVPGTLAYISPERLHGRPATAAADVWAVGVLLWEALAGRHPFLTGSPVEMAKKIELGAPPLRESRPDLPDQLVKLVARAMAPEPARRPSAEKLARDLRRSFEPPKAKAKAKAIRAARPRYTRPELPAVDVHKFTAPLLAAAVTGWSTATMPFYPAGWPLGLAALAAAATALKPKAGLALALAAPVFPLGNVSRGLAVLYAALAAAWLVVSWRRPREALLPAVGALLAPLSLLAFLPLLLTSVGSTVRRGLYAAIAVVLATIVAGIRRSPLPLTGDGPPFVPLAGLDGPVEAARRLVDALPPTIALQALVLGLAAAALPFVARRGPWELAGFGAVLMAALLLPDPRIAALPAVAAVWLTCGLMVLKRA